MAITRAIGFGWGTQLTGDFSGRAEVEEAVILQHGADGSKKRKKRRKLKWVSREEIEARNAPPVIEIRDLALPQPYDPIQAPSPLELMAVQYIEAARQKALDDARLAKEAEDMELLMMMVDG